MHGPEPDTLQINAVPGPELKKLAEVHGARLDDGNNVIQAHVED